MRILGIDPGYATTGFGLIEAQRGQFRLLQSGVITTPADMDFLIAELKPDCAAVEELFWGRNITTGIGVAHGRGVILLALAKSGVPATEYTPMQVKQAVVGYGKAEKHQVMDMTKRILKLEKMVRPDDAADAIAIALCHGRSSSSLLARLTEE